MLRDALEFLVSQLRKAVKASEGQPNISLCSIVNDKGEYGIGAGKLGLSLVNVEEEKYLKSQLPREKRIGDEVQVTNPDIKLNLLIMIAANPGSGNYPEAVERLSLAITFFQGMSFFNKATRLDPGDKALWPPIEQLSVELYSLTLDQQNQLWASIGAKYLPSVVYKVRLIVVDSGVFGDLKPVIKTIDNDLKRIN